MACQDCIQPELPLKLSRMFYFTGTHRIWFTVVLFSLKGVLSLALVNQSDTSAEFNTCPYFGVWRCCFFNRPLFLRKGTCCFPACGTGQLSCKASCPGDCSFAFFSV